MATLEPNEKVSTIDNDFQRNKDIVIDVKNLSKKYCRQLKRSLWYGVGDLFREMTCRPRELKLRNSEFLAVRNATFQVRKGECVALLGPNGAGKSTLMKMLTGLIKPDNGRIRMRGRVGALIELGTGFNPILSGRENVFINGSILGFKKEEIIDRFDDIVAFSEIEDFIDAPIRMYSSGMRARLGFAVAAFLNPQVLLLDEVLAVGDIGFRFKCFTHMRERIKSGMSIIIVSHAVGQLNKVATRSLVMNKRQIIFDGEFPEGLSLYEKLLIKDPEKATKGKTPKFDTMIEHAETLNDKNELCSEFKTGDTIRVRVHIRSKVDIQGARVRLIIESPKSGVLGGVGSAAKEFFVDIKKNSTIVEMDFPDNPLIMGGFGIGAVVLGPGETEFLHRKHPAAKFEIVGPRPPAFGYGEDGIIRFSHKWNRYFHEDE